MSKKQIAGKSLERALGDEHDHALAASKLWGMKTSHVLLIRMAGVFVVFLLTILVYEKSLRYEMIFDDLPAYVENESIRNLSPLFGTDDSTGPLNPKQNTPFTARPLVNLAAAVNYHFGGLNPFGYRFANIIIHAICACLLWSILAFTFRQNLTSSQERVPRHVIAFLSTIVWMLHPVHTETVIYLTQRTELMMGLFYFLTLFFSIRYWCSQLRLVRATWLCLAVLSSVLGMLSKEMIASVPAMVVVYDWMFLSRDVKSMIRKSWPLYLGLTLNWLVAFLIYRWGNGTPSAGFNNSISAVDWWLTQANAFFVYWKLTIWPYPLILHYHVPTMTSLSEAWPGVFGFSLYVVLTLWLLWRRNPMGLRSPLVCRTSLADSCDSITS